MAIIKRKRGNTTYVYEAVYESIENGKQKYKWEILGKLDENGILIPSRKRCAEQAEQVKQSEQSVQIEGQPEVQAVQTAQSQQVSQASSPVSSSQASQVSQESQPAPTTYELHETYDEYDVYGEIYEAQEVEDFEDYAPAEPTAQQEVTPNALAVIDTDSADCANSTYIEDITDETDEDEDFTQISDISNTDIEIDSQSTDSTSHEIVVIDEENQNLLQVTSKKAENFKMGMSKPENILFDSNKNGKIYDSTEKNAVKINVSRGNSQKKRIDTILYIDFNNSKANGVSIPFENRITPYDREIHNAVATLVAAGNKCITPSMIFQLLSGNISDNRNKMSEETRDKIVKSLDKMIVTRITINATAEVKAGMLAEGTYENYLIPAKRVEILINGQRVKDCFVLMDTLPLFAYASQRRQIATIDVKLLNTPLVNTPENIALKAYLLRRILSISNSKNRMNAVIRYDTIYDYLQIKASTPNALKVKRKQIRDKIKILLDFWKKLGVIKQYTEEKEGRSFAKITIYF